MLDRPNIIKILMAFLLHLKLPKYQLPRLTLSSYGERALKLVSVSLVTSPLLDIVSQVTLQNQIQLLMLSTCALRVDVRYVLNQLRV